MSVHRFVQTMIFKKFNPKDTMRYYFIVLNLLCSLCFFTLSINDRGSLEDIKRELEIMSSDEISNYVTSISLQSINNNVKTVLKDLFLNKYILFVQVIHKNPFFCSWLFENDPIATSKECPRNIGLQPIESDFRDAYKSKIKLDHGFIARDRLELVDLTNMRIIHKYCPDNILDFTSCEQDLNTIKVLMSEDRSDIQPWSMRRAVIIDGKSLSNSGSVIGGVHPEQSRPFAAHLVAVKNAFVSSWGYIFDFERWYIHGGCSDRAWHHPTFDYDLSTHTVVSFPEPVLSMIHPFPSMFYHEYIEMHAMFLMALPLLKAMPNITILINKPLVHTKLFPLLHALDVDLNNYNIISVKDSGFNKKSRRNVEYNKLKGSIIYAPYVVTPISLWCQYISRATTHLMRRQYAKHLPYWNQKGQADGIIVYDRYNLRPKRFLVEGYQIYQSLQHRYGERRSVQMYYGNESLEETIVMFRRCNVFVAAHGGGQANMIFMPERAITIEIRPENWPVPCYIDIADNLNIQHYLSVVKDSGRIGEMHIDLTSFLPTLYSLIDSI